MTKKLRQLSNARARKLARSAFKNDTWMTPDEGHMKIFVDKPGSVYEDFVQEHRMQWEDTLHFNRNYWWKLLDMAGETFSEEEWDALPTSESDEAIADALVGLIEIFWIQWEKLHKMGEKFDAIFKDVRR